MINTIEIENLKCGGCASSIKKKLMNIRGVLAVEVNRENETVTIEGSVHRDELTKALSEMGYPEKGENTIGKKLISYVSCVSGKFSDK
jgi:copper chaperone CopZ